MPNIAAIVEGDSLLENGGMRQEHEFHRPLHSVHAVNIAHLNECATVVPLPESKIDRRKTHPIVRNRKIELDAKRRPGAPIRYSRLFNGGIRVKHRLAADLIGAGVKMASEVGQHRALQVLIL